VTLEKDQVDRLVERLAGISDTRKETRRFRQEDQMTLQHLSEKTGGKDSDRLHFKPQAAESSKEVCSAFMEATRDVRRAR